MNPVWCDRAVASIVGGVCCVCLRHLTCSGLECCQCSCTLLLYWRSLWTRSQQESGLAAVLWVLWVRRWLAVAITGQLVWAALGMTLIVIKELCHPIGVGCWSRVTTVDFRLLVPLWKNKVQTDQSDASYTEMSPSMENLIGRFGFSFFHNRTSNLK